MALMRICDRFTGASSFDATIGIDAGTGALEFVTSLSNTLPKTPCSSPLGFLPCSSSIDPTGCAMG